MENLSVCNSAHKGNHSYICKQCQQFTCYNCLMMEHECHLESVCDTKELLLNQLNFYVRLKHRTRLGLQLRELFSTSDQYDQRNIVKVAKRQIAYSYATLMLQLKEHRKSKVEQIRSSKHITALRKNVELIRRQADQLRHTLRAAEDQLRRCWIAPSEGDGPTLYSSLGGEHLARYIRETKSLLDQINTYNRKLEQMRRMELVWTTYAPSPTKLLNICKLEYSKEFEPILYKAHYGQPKLTRYGCLSKKIQTEALLDYVVPHNFGILELSGLVYIVGGQKKDHEERKKYKKSLCVLNPVTKAIGKRQSMHTRRMCLSVTPLLHRYIFAIGGYNVAELIASCELYDINTDRWIYIPSLNQPKSNSGVCTFQERHLYAFAGYVARKDSGDIERLDTLDMAASDKWECVFCTKSGVFEARQNPGAQQITNQEILVFGGVHRGVRQRMCFVFNESERTMSKGTELRSDDIFLDCYSKVLCGKLQAFSCRADAVQKYSIKAKHWDIQSPVSLPLSSPFSNLGYWL